MYLKVLFLGTAEGRIFLKAVWFNIGENTVASSSHLAVHLPHPQSVPKVLLGSLQHRRRLRVKGCVLL